MGFDYLDTVIVGLNPAEGMNVCPYISVLCCVCTGLGIGTPPVQGVLPSVKKQDSETSTRGSLGSPRIAVTGKERNHTQIPNSVTDQGGFRSV
jgi:hypothetical protein